MAKYFVYCIENIETNKFYVGISKKGSGRKSDHFRKLRNDRHANQYLQNSWNKHGKENFQFKIIEKGYNSKKELGEAECFWIDTLQSMYYQDGYNIQHGGYDAELSKESIEKIRKTVSENQGRPVLQYSLDGVFINEYNTISEASRRTGVNLDNISGCCLNYKHYNTAGGYQWFYKEGFNDKDVKNLSKTFSQYDLDGNKLNTYENVSKVADILGVHDTCIYNCLNGNIKSTKGFQWEYGTKDKIDPYKKSNNYPKKVIQYDLDGNLIDVFNTLTEAGKEVDRTPANVTTACKNKGLCADFQWRYWTKDFSESIDSFSGKRIVNKRPVGKFLKNGCLISCYESIKEATRFNNISSSHIGKCCRKKYDSVDEVVWRYL